MSYAAPKHEQPGTIENPQSLPPPNPETTGPVAADALAAESSTFQESNKKSTPLGVRGSSSNFANENTSGATKLDPAPDAEARHDNDEEEYTDGRSARDEDRSGPGHGVYEADRKYNKSAGSDSHPPTTASSDTKRDTAHTTENTQSQPQKSVDTAPGYVLPALGGLSDGKPKGRNLKEVSDFGDDPRTKNASFESEIGSKDDPARLAEEKFERRDAAPQTKAQGNNATGTGEYAALREESL